MKSQPGEKSPLQDDRSATLRESPLHDARGTRVPPFAKGGKASSARPSGKGDSRQALKMRARELRKNQTDAERLLWGRVRRKQIHGVQFYRQRPVDRFIVDFYAPSARLVIEVDGGQHLTDEGLARDAERTQYLAAHNLLVLRFTNDQVIDELDAVADAIAAHVMERIPPAG